MRKTFIFIIAAIILCLSTAALAADTTTATHTTIDTSIGYARENIAINEANFPDPVFRAYVTENIDKNQDGVLSAEEIAGVTELDLSEMHIASLQGIEFFTALTDLDCGYNQLKALDISKNINLEWLDCGDNQLTSLDVSKNINLESLNCGDNQLTALDVSKNINLESLCCSYNQLIALDVSKNINLESLWCSDNQLTALDVSKNINLESLDCGYNQLKALDVSKNINLESLWCSDNQLTALDVSNNICLYGLNCSDNQLTALDVSKSINLVWLWCQNNKIASEAAVVGYKNVSTSFEFEPQKKLITATPTASTVLVNGKTVAFDAYNIAGNNYFKLRDLAYSLNGTAKQFKVDWDAAQNAITLGSGKPYTAVGGEMQGKGAGEKVALPTTSKIYLDGREVRFTAYNIGGNNYFKLRDIGEAFDFGVGWDDTTRTIAIDTSTGYENDRITINATNFPDPIFRAIVSEYFDENQDGVLSAEEIAEVTELDLSEMDITSLQGIEFFTELIYLYCGNNQLKVLDVSKNINLESLWCSDNQLTALDISNNINLTSLWCDNTQLTVLDISNNINLEWLSCDNNRLTKLDVSKNINLESLWCSDNQLTALDVSKNINLGSLSCSENQLTVLDVSKNINLGGLSCSENQLTVLDVSKNINLEILSCFDNQLTVLDVSKNINLEWLWCAYNQLTTLDVSKNTDLTILYCYDNRLKALDISRNTKLNGLDCADNNLTKLDVSKNPVLEYLDCSKNNMVSEAAVTGLDKRVTTYFIFEPQN